MATFRSKKIIGILLPLSLYAQALQADETQSSRIEGPLSLDGGSIDMEYLFKNDEDSERHSAQAGQSLMMDYRFNAGLLAGEFKVNALMNATDSDLFFKYGDRLHNDERSEVNPEQIELYSLNATHLSDDYQINLFYHVPRYHWGYEGDFFGLMEEATDMEGMDIWNSKPPVGIELIGREKLDGLKVVAGKEIFWDAEPMAIVKYQFGRNKRHTIVAAKEQDTDAAKVSLQTKVQVSSDTQLELGVLASGNEKVGESYDYLEDGVVYHADIKTEDTLGAKAKLTHTLKNGNVVYSTVQYAGLVADAGETVKEFGSELPYSNLGNKAVFELGAKINRGNYTFTPKIFVRENQRDANPNIAPRAIGNTLIRGIDPRNYELDPFAISGNRQALAVEAFLTYDPTPGTFFYEWDNDQREDAKFAYNVGLTVTDYQKTSDAHIIDDITVSNGIAPETMWTLSSKMVFNKDNGKRALVKLQAGNQQGQDPKAEASNYYSAELELALDKKNTVSLRFDKDKFGPFDFQKDWGIAFPEQIELGYRHQINDDRPSKKSSVVGIKAAYRSFDEPSADDSSNGSQDSLYEVKAFYTLKF